MGFYHHPSTGTFHLQEVVPRRVVPSHERHRWNGKPAWGESATCLKCGCVKHRLKTQPDYTEHYQLLGTEQLLTDRPPCSTATAGPGTAPASATPPAPTMLPGLTASPNAEATPYPTMHPEPPTTDDTPATYTASLSHA